MKIIALITQYAVLLVLALLVYEYFKMNITDDPDATKDFEE
jgi:hypothetical protein